MSTSSGWDWGPPSTQNAWDFGPPAAPASVQNLTQTQSISMEQSPQPHIKKIPAYNGTSTNQSEIIQQVTNEFQFTSNKNIVQGSNQVHNNNNMNTQSINQDWMLQKPLYYGYRVEFQDQQDSRFFQQFWNYFFPDHSGPSQYNARFHDDNYGTKALAYTQKMPKFIQYCNSRGNFSNWQNPETHHVTCFHSLYKIQLDKEKNKTSNEKNQDFNPLFMNLETSSEEYGLREAQISSMLGHESELIATGCIQTTHLFALLIDGNSINYKVKQTSNLTPNCWHITLGWATPFKAGDVGLLIQSLLKGDLATIPSSILETKTLNTLNGMADSNNHNKVDSEFQSQSGQSSIGNNVNNNISCDNLISSTAYLYEPVCFGLVKTCRFKQPIKLHGRFEAFGSIQNQGPGGFRKRIW